MTYAGSGVDYSTLDPFKRACQMRAALTARNLPLHGFQELSWSRGESAYLMRTPTGPIIAHVEEGLGTKNLVADALALSQIAAAVGGHTGKTYYDQLAQDTVAMIVNDMITLGVLPRSVAMHVAVASGAWFAENPKRSEDLVNGWGHACDLSECVWGGGETPSLKDVIVPGAALLSGSAVGYAEDEASLLHPDDITDGDVIVIVESSGVHANGLTLARKIAERLPEGYLTTLSDGRTYGDTLLDATLIYVPFLKECLNSGLAIKYAVNVTGHGWAKFMRASGSFDYVIQSLPTELPIFEFIMRHGKMDEREMYKTYNMGAGFAVYVHPDHVDSVIETADNTGFTAYPAGYIRTSKEKRVIIEPNGITFTKEDLQVR